MKLPRPSVSFFASLLTAVSCSAALAQITPADPLPSANAAANASIALNNGGNPAGAMGAATLNDRAVPNSAPIIAGNSGTVGVNGSTGDALAASSVNGNDALAIAGAESIGMRRERFRAQSEMSARPTTAVAPADNSVVAVETAFAPVAIRATAMDGRDQLATQLNQNIQAGRRALAAAEAQARQLAPDARAEFESAARQARAAERRLTSSLRAAQTAPYDEWSEARDTLASHYESFSQAVAHAQHLATAGSARSSTTLGRQ
jgi:hypothetical protein